jgi:hypothetical protein
LLLPPFSIGNSLQKIFLSDYNKQREKQAFFHVTLCATTSFNLLLFRGQHKQVFFVFCKIVVVGDEAGKFHQPITTAVSSPGSNPIG